MPSGVYDRSGADGWEWTLTVLPRVEGPHRGEQRLRLRLRTAQGEKATDVTRAELPGRIAELCTRLGLEGLTIGEGIDLAALAKMRAEQLADIDREIGEREVAFEVEMIELRQRRKRLVLEERELAKALARVEAGLGKPGTGSSQTSAKIKASWTPERRAKMAEAMRRRNAERLAKVTRGKRVA